MITKACDIITFRVTTNSAIYLNILFYFTGKQKASQVNENTTQVRVSVRGTNSHQ